MKDIVDEDKTKGQFYLTVSQSMKIMKNINDSPAGRVGAIKLPGLSIVWRTFPASKLESAR